MRLFVVRVTGGKPRSLGSCASPEGSCHTWAPDGRRIGLVRNERDLFVTGVGGGRGRRVARNAYHPAWSPDGRWISYSSRGVWLVSPSGRARRRVFPRPGASAWSPDSTRLAVNDGDVIRLVPLRGGRTRRLGSAGGAPLWSPNGRWIAFEHDGFFELLSPTVRGHRIFRASTGNVGRGGLSWSPDGKRLFYGVSLDEMAAPLHLYVVRSNGTGLRRLPVGVAGHPRWSPDGTRIAYVCGSSVCVSKADGTARKRVVGGVNGPGLSWSPDGAALAFVRRGNVHAVFVDGSGLRQVSRTPGSDADSAFDPAWSPDGRSIAFTHEEVFSEELHAPCCTETLMVVGADGGEPRQLTVNYPVAYYPRPAWAPDGTRIAFVDQEGTEFCEEGVDGTECPPSHLFTISSAGGTITPVGGLDRRDQFHPAWSPDGAFLAYDDGLDISVVRKDGSGRRSILGSAARQGWEESPDWQPRCTLYGTARSDRLTGTPTADVICALGGNDTIDALGGDDIVIGGDGNDRIVGGSGEDRLFGAFGNDTIEALDGAQDIVDGGPGMDTAAADAIDLQRLVP